MNTLLINIQQKSELKFLKSLMKKLGYETTVLSETEKEEVALGHLMKQNSQGDTLTLEEAEAYYKKLKKAD